MSLDIPIIELNKETCRELVDNAILGIAIIQNKKLVYANRSLADITGHTLEDMFALSSNDFMSMVYPDDRTSILGAVIDGISSNKLPLRQEFRIVRKNGDIAWIDARANFIEYKGYPAMQVAFLDISSRKNAENEANAAKEEYIEILSSISDGFFALDENLKITYFNKAAESLLGRTSSEVLGRNMFDAFPETRGSIFEDTYTWAAREKRPISFETYFGAKPYENWYEMRVHPRRNGISVYFQIITDRKAAEEALRQSEEQHRLLFETMLHGVIYQDAEGKIISANPVAERILGLSLDQMKGRTAFDPGWKAIREDGSNFPRESHPSEIALATGKAIENAVMGIFNPNDANYRWININAVPQFLPGETKPYRIYITFEDITERKKAEETLSKILAMLTRSQEIGHLGNWTLDFDTGKFEASDEDYRIYGLVPGVDTILDHIWTLIHPDDLDRYREYVESVRLEGRLGGIDYRIVWPDGSVHYVHAMTASVVRDQNGRVKIASGITQDITERKRMEVALRKSEQKFRSIVESSEEGINLIDDSGNIVEWNASQEYITGLKREEVLGKPAWDIKFQLIPQEQRTQEAYEKLKFFLLRLTDKGRIALKGWYNDQEIQSADGKRKIIHEVLFPIKAEKGFNIGVITHDITERMQSEKSLRIKNEAIESSLNAMSLASPLGDLFYANKSWLRMLGYEREEIEGRSLLDFPQDPRDADEIKRQISATGRWEGELVAKKKDGSYMDVHLSVSMVKDKSDRPICIISSFIDISDSKKIQRELKEREERFRKIFELSPIGIQLFDAEGFLASANQASLRIMGITDTARHKRYNIFRDVLLDVENQHKLMNGQIVNQGSWIMAKPGRAAKIDRDVSQERKGQIYIENIITSLGGDGGEPEGYLCLQQDLTEHKLADEVMIGENERLQIIYDIWKTRVKTSDMRMND